MKPLSTAIVSVLIGATGVMGTPRSALAMTIQPGIMCKPYLNSNIGGLYSQLNGAYNQSGAQMSVVCPIVRPYTFGTTGAFSMYVDGTSGNGTMTCIVSSFNYNGSFIASTSFQVNGVFDQLVSMTAQQTPAYSYQVLFCSMPTNAGIFDIEPLQ